MDQILRELREDRWSSQVLSTPQFSELLARYGGQAIAQVDKNTLTFGVSPEFIEARRKQIEAVQKNFTLETLRNSGFSWLVYPCKNFAADFSEISRQRIETAVQEARLVDHSYESGKTCLKIFRLEEISN